MSAQSTKAYFGGGGGAGLAQWWSTHLPSMWPGLGDICGLSLLVLYSALRGFPPGTPVFPSLQKTYDFSDLICVLLKVI